MSGWSPEEADPAWSRPQLRRLTAEAVGTFVLVLVAAGGCVAAAVSHGAVGHTAAAITPGAMVLALVYILGEISGARLNPVAALAFAAQEGAATGSPADGPRRVPTAAREEEQ
jgi:hypothetical protein